jgi:hypothetical protein
VSGQAAALVIAADAEGARSIPGTNGAALEVLLSERALEWGARVAPDRVGALRSQDIPGADQRGPRIAAAAVELLEAHLTPLLIVSAAFPALGPAHDRAALDDLSQGVDVVVGPAISGEWFLLALSGPHPALLQTLAGKGADSAPALLGAAAGAGLAIGMLRSERALRNAADAAALRADPLLEPELRAALGPAPNTI